MSELPLFVAEGFWSDLTENFWTYLLTTLYIGFSTLLILVVLIQRGRGGGLVSGLSGFSAQTMGTRVGDTMTVITVSLAALYILSAMALTWVVRHDPRNLPKPKPKAKVKAPVAPQPPELLPPELPSADGTLPMLPPIELPPIPKKSEAKPETKPETKPEVKPETKPELKTETKPETKPEVKSETKPETKPEVKSETKPETKPEVKPETKPETKPE